MIDTDIIVATVTLPSDASDPEANTLDHLAASLEYLMRFCFKPAVDEASTTASATIGG